MKKKSSVAAIFAEFLTRYPKHFLLLFLLLVMEGVVAAMSVMSIVPIADFVLDPTFAKPSRITRIVITGLHAIDLHPALWIFGTLFFLSSIFKGGMGVTIRYAILRIKYAVVRGLFGDALHTFFKARWGFFSGSDQGRLLNTLNKELNTIGDTLGQIGRAHV